MTAGQSSTLSYDVANRVASATNSSNATEYYGYAPDNKRIYRLASDWQTEQFTFYGAQGEKLGVFSLQIAQPIDAWPPTLQLTPVSSNVWFAGKQIWEGGGAVLRDRLGSNRAGGARFLAYGEETSSTPNDRTKFATYTRDSFTGLDYADQRFYASVYGRFNTVDPLQSSAKPKNPTSWNRYAYVGGDPISLLDPRGMEQSGCGDGWVSDPSLSGPCCPPGGSGLLPDPSVDPDCYAGDGSGGADGAGDEPEALTCQSDGFLSSAPALRFDIRPGQPSRQYYGIPISLPFYASGGTGSYTWSIQQDITSTVSELGPQGEQAIVQTEVLPNVADTQTGQRAIFFDAPGIQVAPRGNFTVIATWAATDVVTVTSGAQTVQCPEVSWTASEIIIRSGTGISVTGGPQRVHKK